MRGKKASYYEGGHRVPFFIHWPAGNLNGGRDIGELCLDVDLLPTMMDLCKLNCLKDLDPDGTSLAALLAGELRELPGDRLSFIQYDQNTNPPPRERNTVISRQWRLVYEKELYDITVDPGQKRDVSVEHPEVVERLKNAHDKWWNTHSPRFGEYSPISLGNDAENPTRLDAMDVMGDVAWNQMHIAMAVKSAGKWTVKVEQKGLYKFSLRRWPEEINIPTDDVINSQAAESLAPYIKGNHEIFPVTIHPVQTRLCIFGQNYFMDYKKGTCETTFLLKLDTTGITELEAEFIDETGEAQGAYYVYIERL
jgi:arylsulfatase B